MSKNAPNASVATREVVVFAHDSALGNARAHTLFDRVKAKKNSAAPRRFTDYDLSVDLTNLPNGVKGYRLSNDEDRANFFATLT